jgi:hypothetical protein
MRAAIIVLLAAASLPALAENTLTDQERAFIARQQRIQQDRRERAQVRCVEQRGADCVTDQGLQEWTLLERSREDAVLDRISVESPSMSGAGSTSSPYGQGLPSPTGAFGRPLPGQQR